MQKLVLVLLLLFIPISGIHSNNRDTLFTQDEIVWIKAHLNSLHFAPDPNWEPIDYIDSEGEHKGIVADLLKIIEDRTGLNFIKVNYDVWSDALNDIKAGDLDVMGSVQKTSEREQFLHFTNPFIDIPIVVLVRSDFSEIVTPKQLNSMRLAAVKGYAYIDYVRNAYPEAEIIEYDDHLTSLIQTSLGNTDGVITDLMVASELVRQYNIPNLSIGKKLDFSFELRFAVRKDLEILNTIIDKVLADNVNLVIPEIVGSRVNISYLQPDNFIIKNYRYIVASIIVLLITTIFIIFINRSLKRKVAIKTAELNEEIEKKNRALEKAMESDRLKTAFLNNLSHEVRTPMNSIIGFSDLLTEHNFTQIKTEQYSSIIQRSAKQLLNIVESILEMAMIESGEVKPEIDEFDLSGLVLEIFQIYEPKALQKGLKIIINTPSVSVSTIKSDRDKIKRILSNLLDNAIKFTNSGEITLDYKTGPGYVLFSVHDSGIGVPELLHEKIFERFYKIESLDTEYQEGCGLGLSIARKLSLLINGSVIVDSSNNTGTRMILKIDVA